MSEPGYWHSPWPAEDAGPRRLATTRTGHPPRGPLEVTARTALGGTMCVLRDEGEVFLLTHTLGGSDTTSRVERIDARTLEPIDISDDLPGGPFWPGGMAAHADGSLYVTYGRWCHRLGPDCSVLARRELPRERPYNSLVVLSDGTLVMKDIGSRQERVGGILRQPDEHPGAGLVFLAPGTLEVIALVDLPEPSIARLGTDGGDTVVVVGDESVWTVRLADGGPEIEELARYRTLDGQTYGWDPVVTPDGVWFLDNGAGSEDMAGRGHFTGLHTDDPAAPPLHLVRVGWSGEVLPTPVCGRPGGIVANPPIVDTDRRIAVGYDSGNGALAAWRYDGDVAAGLTPLWQRAQGHGSHLVLWADDGVLLTGDFDAAKGTDGVVLLDIEEGEELGRVATGSPVQSVLFPAPGWHDDAYVVSFTTVARVHGRGA